VKDRQSLTIFIVVIVALLLVGFFCYTQLEIVPATTWQRASKEARANEYLALDRWLEGVGYTIRSASVGGVEAILKGPEKTIFIENSRFNWLNKERLLPWIEEGGRMIVSLDVPPSDSLGKFMETLGVKRIDSSLNSFYEDDSDDSKNPEDSDNSKNPNGSPSGNKLPEITKIPPVENPLYFDWQTSFAVMEETSIADRILLMGDKSGNIKLVKLELGKGWAVFTGKAYFLHNYGLNRGDHAALARELFLAENVGQNILFIRMLNGERHLLGNLAERGNPTAMAVSLALLIIAGFWMVIPSFGRYTAEPERPGKPLRERFLAEGRFLAKYRALGKYVEIYRRELEQRNRIRGIATSFSKAPLQEIPSAVLPLSLGEFIKEQALLSKQLEELNS